MQRRGLAVRLETVSRSEREGPREEPSCSDPEAVPPWDERIFALIDSGVDGTLIEENLRRTPTERLRRMQQMLRVMEQARRG